MPATILVADDDPMTLKILSRALASEGYVVHCCDSGAGALEQLRARSFAILLTDYLMPDLDGTELVAEALRLNPAMRCILMSGHERPPHVLAHVTWLTKPLSIDVLVDAIAAELRAAGAP